ncbi:MAG: GntR family transcriptional regulator [Acidobacteriota bacterium]|nr:GntR family transcriptional regulator [Acidobacteriota bacterium]
MESAQPSPRPHRQLRDFVSDKVRADILEGRIGPGHWLRQEQLASELGVSQMPVREALRGLAAEGLVEHVPYRGVRVLAFHVEDVEDLYAVRAALEGRAARAAAGKITPAELRELWSLLRQMSARLGPKQIDDYRELNRLFHGALASASHRPFIVRALRQLWSAFPSMLLSRFAETQGTALPGRDEADVAEHERILVALERRDPGAAERAAREHIEVAGRHLVAALRGTPARPGAAGPSSSHSGRRAARRKP